MKTLKTILFVAIVALISSCTVTKPGVSYTKIFKEKKGLNHTFILDRNALIWVLNYKNNCLPMQAEIQLTFSEEMPYKRFKQHKYQVQELHGYNCDGEYAIVADLDSPLVYLLRTMRLKTIRVKTLDAGQIAVNVDGDAIFKAVAALNWKTPIPVSNEEFTL